MKATDRAVLLLCGDQKVVAHLKKSLSGLEVIDYPAADDFDMAVLDGILSRTGVEVAIMDRLFLEKHDYVSFHKTFASVYVIFIMTDPFALDFPHDDQNHTFREVGSNCVLYHPVDPATLRNIITYLAEKENVPDDPDEFSLSDTHRPTSSASPTAGKRSGRVTKGAKRKKKNKHFF